MKRRQIALTEGNLKSLLVGNPLFKIEGLPDVFKIISIEYSKLTGCYHIVIESDTFSEFESDGYIPKIYFKIESQEDKIKKEEFVKGYNQGYDEGQAHLRKELSELLQG